MAEGERVLLTGASSGIGLAVARRLLRGGYRVTGISRGGSPKALRDDNFGARAIDLADLAGLETALGELLREQEFDCFVHAAGRGDFGSIEQFSVARIEHSMRVNLLSGMVICRGLVPQMRRRRRGRIVFIGSESALHAGRKGALYSAAKFGLRGFCQSLREDLASDGIPVSLVNPGMVRSPFFDKLSFRPGAQPENAIDVEDVAEVVEQILRANSNIVIDEVNLSPRIKSIDFSSRS
jgi:short-subunit dehydrogenase